MIIPHYSISTIENGTETKILRAILPPISLTTALSTTTKTMEFTLQNTVATQILKFQVISWYGKRGGLQFFDIIRTPKIARSGYYTVFLLQMVVANSFQGIFISEAH